MASSITWNNSNAVHFIVQNVSAMVGHVNHKALTENMSTSVAAMMRNVDVLEASLAGEVLSRLYHRLLCAAELTE